MMAKFYVTKYALTQGIIEVEGEVCDGFPDMIEETEKTEHAYFKRTFHGKNTEWHETKESAIKKAEEMRDKKIASLRKQIEKLERMKF